MIKYLSEISESAKDGQRREVNTIRGVVLAYAMNGETNYIKLSKV